MRRYLARMKWAAIAAVALLACGLPAQAGQESAAVFMGRASLDKWECCHLVPVTRVTTALVVFDVGGGTVHFQLTRLGSQNDTFNLLDGMAVTGHNGYVLRLQPAIYRASVTPAGGAPQYFLLVDLNGE